MGKALTLDAAAAEREIISAGIAIYGATPAGIAGALSAAEGECSVLLIEPTARIGGMTTHGLSHSDFHSFESLHGPFLQFSQRVLKHYRENYGEDSQQVRDSWRGTHGEPSVNLLIFQQMLAEKPSIRILTEHRLTRMTVEDHLITRDQNQVRAHQQMTWQPGQKPMITKTNLQDPRLVDTVDLSFNLVTKRFSVGLGEFDLAAATIAKEYVEHLITQHRKDRPPAKRTDKWLDTLPDEIHDRLAAIGLIEARKQIELPRTVLAYMRAYIDSRTDWKKPENYKQSVDHLESFMKRD